MKYRAKAGGHVFELDLEEERVFVNGEAAEISFVQVGNAAYSLILGGRSARVHIEPQPEKGTYRVTVDGNTFEVEVLDEREVLLQQFATKATAVQGRQVIRAPMPGLVRRVFVDEGQRVEAGQGLLVLEAMKMENELRAEISGRVQTVSARVGVAVGKNELLVEILGGD